MREEGFEILFDGTMSRKGERMLEALTECAPEGSVRSPRYSGKFRNIVMYGAGLDVRVRALAKHRESGGQAVIWDLGYWDREEGAAMRLSIGSLHPTAEQLALVPAGHREAPLKLREDADPNGPILLIGLGTKSCALYGLQPMQWERQALAKIRKRFGGRKVLWRPKGRRPVHLQGTTLRHGMPIEEALRGCSLVVARHSNVAVDACVAGVPVECQDGAARSLYSDSSTPTREARAEFLRRLAWFNWRPREAPQAWDWIQQVLAP